ncbi:MAG: glycosyl hydrolase 115 family protein, partial [Verrucomicrobiae bacterium]|nr:glycosyl hydrolase 115 family protein [Verrucomicrobiae bacterium]
MRCSIQFVSTATATLLPLLAPAAVDLTSDASSAFPLVKDGVAAPIVVAGDVPKVIRLAAEDLAEDVERVTGVRPEIVGRRPESGKAAVELRLAPDSRGHWETYRLSATDETLVVDGTDPRGLAYGIYDLSKRIGVSPWHWWADVPVSKRKEIQLTIGTEPTESPAVKYRGIFLNDEGWGLRPWAAKTFEPEVGNIGPKTYARIFELLLRLRANTIWPAMHEGTTPFHRVPGNAKVADDFGIVLGSSHAEPMLRNNVGEWRRPYHQYNFLANRGTIVDYWEERVKQRTNGESIFTLGMRGVHDS